MTDETIVDHMVDAQGRLVPRKLVKDIDLARDSLVRELIGKAVALSKLLAAFKAEAARDLQAFVDLSAEQYGVTVGGGKGNLTLLSYDGRFKVTRQIADHLVFDERLQAAKRLIDECIREWSAGSDDKIRALVEHAFQVDKQGKVSTERVLGLRRLNIDDATWLRAMRAISDSVQVSSSKSYLRFYERVGDSEQWQAISLDLASVEEVAS
jgi:hypothetical protein